MSFPTTLDTFAYPNSSQKMDDPAVLSTVIVADLNDAATALEEKVGIDWSADTTSLDYKTTRLTAKWDIQTHDWTNYIKKAVWPDWYMLVADSTKPTWLDYIAPTSWGTVTSVSVVSANGFTWSVATATTVPAITLTTSVTWLLKGNWTAISAAAAWTDYVTPTGSGATLTGIFPVWMITPYAWTAAPTGWLICDWTAYSRTVTYSALFAVTSTLYWVGDGATTFNIPDLRGRVPVGKNSATFATLGSTGWAETHTLIEAEMPVHNHDALMYAGGWAQTSLNLATWVDSAYQDLMNGSEQIIYNAGGGWAHNNLQPYQTINYIIKF